MFKTSVRGFKKSDVNNYIIAMHSEFADKKEALEEELAHNREELRMATVHLYIKDEMIRDLNAEIAALSSLSDENEKLTRENKKLTSEAALLQDKINSLTQEMSVIL
ncbi:MAG: hypothetical protein IKV40_02550, partial [Clostridia bacterium]|nr:hypothetical protein [Clostridia bacterium]